LPRDHGPHEFRWYRKVLQAGFAFLAIGGVLYLLASIAGTIYARREVKGSRPRISGRADSVAELMSCERDVDRLFRDLGDQVFGLQALTARQEIDLAQRWEDWRKGWLARWLEVEHRCRFRELRDRGYGTAYDRMAYVHEELEEIEQRLDSLLRSFIEHEAPRLDEIRRELDRVRRELDRRRAETARRP
jgi:hypothetical protein